MKSPQEEWVASLGAIKERDMHFTQTGGLRDAALSALREHIKEVMIPLLIRSFQTPSQAGDDVSRQLQALDVDLKNLLRWCHSCRGHIHKALTLAAEQKALVPGSATQESVSSKTVRHILEERLLRLRATLTCSESSHTVRSWWSKLLKK
jgi:hypothetical protein